MKYSIVIHKDQNSDYGVTFPDVPGCFSAGSTIEEAISMAQEAAECHIEGLLLDSEPIPVSTSIEQHQNNLNYQDALWALIEIDISSGKQTTYIVHNISSAMLAITILIYQSIFYCF